MSKDPYQLTLTACIAVEDLRDALDDEEWKAQVQKAADILGAIEHKMMEAIYLDSFKPPVL